VRADRAEEILARAEAVVRAAADRLQAMQGVPLDTARKEGRDIVTAADLAAERMLIEGLLAITPGAAILAEESGTSGPPDGPRWVIDPLDGTVNYASGLPWYSCTVAYQEHGVTELGLVWAPAAGLVGRYIRGRLATVNGRNAAVSEVSSLGDAVVSVVLASNFGPDEVRSASAIIDRLGRATRGVRIVVSGAYEMALVASGRLAAFVTTRADICSHAAAMPLVRAAGGKVTRLDGADASDADAYKIASNGSIHAELLACIRESVAQ
jgi:myo-inositol-1(or 4)-monophosphatase